MASRLLSLNFIQNTYFSDKTGLPSCQRQLIWHLWHVPMFSKVRIVPLVVMDADYDAVHEFISKNIVYRW